MFGVAGLVTRCVAPALTFSNAQHGRRWRSDCLRASAKVPAASLQPRCCSRGRRRVDRDPAFVSRRPDRPSCLHLDGNLADDLPLAFAFGAGGWLCQLYSRGVHCRFYRAPKLCSGCGDQHCERRRVDHIEILSRPEPDRAVLAQTLAAKASKRTIEAVYHAIGPILDTITSAECANYFAMTKPNLIPL
jgi:hypothetical protein